MTNQLHTGVWLSDMPLDENEGASSEELLCLELDEVRVAPFEWIEEGKGYREFLVPAAIVNTGKVRALKGQGRANKLTAGQRRASARKASKAAAKARTQKTEERGRTR